MIIETLFPTHPMSSDMAMVHIARRLSEKVTDLEGMLDDECRRSKYLADLLQTMGARAELRTSTYDGSKYISLGYIGDKNPKFDELVKYLDLKEEVKECEDTSSASKTKTASDSSAPREPNSEATKIKTE